MMDPFDNGEELIVLVWFSECVAFTADNASKKVCGLVVGLEVASKVETGKSSNIIGVNPDN